MSSLSLNNIHDQAMGFVDRAFFARQEGDLEAAHSYLKQAYTLERQAAERFKDKFASEPSRSILYRSAASLALDCGLIEEAERLAETGLAGNPPPDVAKELQGLLENVNSRRHLALRNDVLTTNEVQISSTESVVAHSSVSPYEILKTLDAVMKAEVPPGFFKMLISRSARDLAHEIQLVKTEQIKVRIEYIEGLSNMIDIYIKAQEHELQARNAGTLLTDLDQLRDDLHRATDSSISSLWEAYFVNVNRINAVRNLSPERKEERLKAAYVQIMRASDQAYISLLDQLKKLIKQIVNQVQRT